MMPGRIPYRVRLLTESPSRRDPVRSCLRTDKNDFPAPTRKGCTMPIRFAHLLCLSFLLVFLLSGASCDSGGSSPQPAPPPAPSVAFGDTGNPNGGPAAAAAGMNSTASTLANLIIDYREQAGLTPVLMADDTLAGVAQWQANDMAAHSYVGLVGSDGEDVFNRLANSGYANAWAGVIAGGGSSDPQAVFSAMQTDSSADAILLYNGSDTFSQYRRRLQQRLLDGHSRQPRRAHRRPARRLAAPTLSATAGTGSVSLTWTAVTGATSYTVYRGAASGSETSYVTGVPGTNYTDTGVTDGTTYYYTVAAVNASGTAANRTKSRPRPRRRDRPRRPRPCPPWPAPARSVSTWTTSAGATSYTIYRGSASGSETSYQTGVTATFYIDTSVTNGTTYYYTVAAVNSSGTSSQSNEVSATPTGTSSLQITTATRAHLGRQPGRLQRDHLGHRGNRHRHLHGGAWFAAGDVARQRRDLDGHADGNRHLQFRGHGQRFGWRHRYADLHADSSTRAVTIVTTTVPNGTVGQAYSATISTAGGTGAITLTLSSGSLPPGLTLNSAGGSGARRPPSSAAGSMVRKAWHLTRQATSTSPITATTRSPR